MPINHDLALGLGLAEKVTASRVTARYRSAQAVDPLVVDVVAGSLEAVFEVPCLDDPSIKLNKATAHSWLVYTARSFVSDEAASHLGDFLEWFERTRGEQRERARHDADDRNAIAVTVFNDRASARVNDVSSVLLRDAVLWALTAGRGLSTAAAPRSFLEAFAEADGPAAAESEVLEVVSRLDWAALR
jgi:hypothetical protein